jgi:alpha-glucosidase (family GH31 glycosyl hydrolase)
MTFTAPLWLLTLACGGPQSVEVGGLSVSLRPDGTLDLVGTHGRWEGLAAHPAPRVDVEAEFNLGSFRFGEDAPALPPAAVFTELTLTDGVAVAVSETGGALQIADDRAGGWTLTWSEPGALGLSVAMAPEDAFVGLGSHAQDVEHRGEAFPLWVSEPGIGKTESDVPSEDWYLTGTKHASSYPQPWVVRPNQPSGMLIDTPTRVDVDLGASNPDRWSVFAWDTATITLLEAPDPRALVSAYSARHGRPRRVPAWALAPWVDAVRGEARVLEVAERMRAARAPVGVVWTEDWKGANETATGYRLSEEWTLDRNLYPNAEAVADALHGLGMRWFAYFAPFVGMTAASGAEAEASRATITTADGTQTYSHTGVTFKPTSQIDVFDPAGTAWVLTRMQAVVAAGFDGWMADYGEWLPTDASVGADNATDGLAVHNDYPRAWQELSEQALGDVDGVAFCRSGWHGSGAACPVVWVGDQRTSFDEDDGLPSVLPLTIGLSWGGVGVVTHDVAGYQSVGNPPSTEELWNRWATLGAYSPILRTHHGSQASANWQFDQDETTVQAFAAAGRAHMTLFPYRAGLAARAADAGIPMVEPTAWSFPGEPWDRLDAWMLGPSLLVAPVVTADADGRDVALPASNGTWYRWPSLEPTTSGYHAAGWTEIPVFLAPDSLIPTFDILPDTMDPAADPAWIGPEDADASRTLVATRRGAAFVEADGTAYTAQGTATVAAEATVTLRAGDVSAGGLTVQIDGPTERTYRLVVRP